MKKARENRVLRENRRLKMRNSLLKSMNNNLWEELNLAEGLCLLRYYDFLEATQERYGAMLSPMPINLKGEYDSSSGDLDYDEHKFNSTDVIAIKSYRKYKLIFLAKPVYSKEKKLGAEYSIKVESNFPELLRLLDRAELRILQISKSLAVNVEFFEIRNRHLHCTVVNSGDRFTKNFTAVLDREKQALFKEKKNTISHMVSFQKVNIRSFFGLP